MFTRAFIFLFFISHVSASGGEAPPVPSSFVSTTLCQALESVDVGEKMEVIVSGVHQRGAEHSFFYDTRQPYCELDVQPYTWFELGETAKPLPDEYSRMMEEADRVFVTVRGSLYGPGLPDLLEDDESIPWIGSLSRRAPRRYGHLNGFRTQLIAEEILEFSRVPETTPGKSLWGSAYPKFALKLVGGDLPHYPKHALSIGLEGDVHFEVLIRDGKPEEIKRLTGDRLLAAGAQEQIESWEFEPLDEDVRITPRFIFRLEKWSAQKGPNPLVETHLPFWVKVTAPRKGW